MKAAFSPSRPNKPEVEGKSHSRTVGRLSARKRHGLDQFWSDLPGTTQRSWHIALIGGLRAERRSAGIPAASRAFGHWRCGNLRVPTGISGSLVRDPRGMRRCRNWQKERFCAGIAIPSPLVRAGAKFENGVLVERPDESASGDAHAALHADPRALTAPLGAGQFPLIVICQCAVARRVVAPRRGARQRPGG
jgi:hypothetical protein